MLNQDIFLIKKVNILMKICGVFLNFESLVIEVEQVEMEFNCYNSTMIYFYIVTYCTLLSNV